MRSLTLFLIIGSLLTMATNAQTTVQSSDGVSVTVSNTDRIITMGGTITETVYALGKGSNVIATDQSSTFPRQVFQLPRVPYLRNLTSEGVLSLGASLIISSNDAGPESAIDQIRSAGTDMLLIKETESLEGVIHKLSVIGKALNAEEKANELIEKNKLTFKTSTEIRSTLKTNPKVMFILAVRGSSNFMVAGNNTAAQAMIEFAGGKNAFDSFSGYKQASLESIIAANPDYILMMQSRFDEISTGIKQTPGVNAVKAVANDNIIGMEGNYLLGFGPRFGSAILDLMKLIHPGVNI
ncbi:MAG: ABC transporter substrate-binding protein [Balneola sp.]